MKTNDELISDVMELWEYHNNETARYEQVLVLLGYSEIKKAVTVPVIIKQDTIPDKPPTEKHRVGLVASKICQNPNCKKEFKPTSNVQKYCTKECAGKPQDAIVHHTPKEILDKIRKEIPIRETSEPVCNRNL